MFLTREQIMQKTKAIIADDVDNDVLFVVAHKGIGKMILSISVDR